MSTSRGGVEVWGVSHMAVNTATVDILLDRASGSVILTQRSVTRSCGSAGV